ncbi:hypothetical protein AB0J28_10550 [Streptosporangium canum]|uniref:hypothetical protein n=1 Tax=Streptosporangium canum TaxID=324952 RepID=UPI00342621DB
MARYEMLAPHLHEGVPLARLAAGQGESGVIYQTLQRWLAAYRRGGLAALARGWLVPTYWTVHKIVSSLDPALVTLGVQGTKKYRETYELVYRREAAKPNEIWQADHTELDIWVVDDKGRPDRPWLTAIEDDHSSPDMPNLEAPSALTTALAFQHAIWRKSEPSWPDHGPICALATATTTPPLKSLPPSPASPAATSGSPFVSPARSSAS